ASKQRAELQAENSYHREEGVAKGMTQHHPALARTLGPGRAHVVEPEYLQHRRTHQPRDQGYRGDRERKRRQEGVPQRLTDHADVTAGDGREQPGPAAERRQPAELEREQQYGEDAEPE